MDCLSSIIDYLLLFWYTKSGGTNGMTENEYVTATEAARLLDVSKTKIAKLLRSGEIPYIQDPHNERAKLVQRSDIDSWIAQARRPRVPHRRREQPQAAEAHQSAS